MMGIVGIVSRFSPCVQQGVSTTRERRFDVKGETFKVRSGLKVGFPHRGGGARNMTVFEKAFGHVIR